MSRILNAIKSHHPDSVALSEPQYQVTYGDLTKLISVYAEKLNGLRCAALAMNNKIEWMLWDLAAIFSNVALVPLPPFFTKEQREHVIKTAGCDAIITAEGVIPLVYDPVEIPQNTAKITFTSGTTGTPKGVCLSLSAMEDVATSIVQVLGKGLAGVHASVMPLAVLLENVAGVYATLLAGGQIRFHHLERFGENYSNLHAALKESQATSIILVPEILRILMAQIAKHGDLPSLSFVAVGGSKVSSDLVLQARMMGIPAYEGYGLSECASVVALNTPTNNRAGSVGKFLPHISGRIEDGEIILLNNGFLGYIGSIAPNSINTGDLGMLDDAGFLSITGRKKNILITSYGRNISPEWVEAELLTQPEIAQAIVYGDACPYLSAYIVPSSSDVDVAAAVAHVNAHLPEYAHVKDFRTVPPFSLKDGTLTGTGRPRRSRIMQIYQKEKLHDIL